MVTPIDKVTTMRTRRAHLMILVLLVVGAVFVFKVNPEVVTYPPCFFKKLTGLQCPGCGSARACYHLLHGHIITAIDYNLLLTFFMPLLSVDVFSRIFLTKSDVRGKPGFIQRQLKPFHVLVIVIFFWVTRNLPVAPFNLLSSDL